MSHSRDFAVMTYNYETDIEYRAYLIHLSISGDARQFYDTLIQHKKSWNAISVAFKLRYSLADK